MSKKKIEREIIKINQENWGDFTGHGPWELNGEIYNFIEDYPSRDCDGECHNVVVERQSDKKLFRFTWEYSHGRGNYYFDDDELEEVFLKIVTTRKYE